MNKSLCIAMLVASLLLLEITCQETMLAPPERPDEFRSPGELRQYLRALNEYYAIVGRPRFGRSASSHKRSAEELTDLARDE